MMSLWAEGSAGAGVPCRKPLLPVCTRGWSVVGHHEWRWTSGPLGPCTGALRLWARASV